MRTCLTIPQFTIIIALASLVGVKISSVFFISISLHFLLLNGIEPSSWFKYASLEQLNVSPGKRAWKRGRVSPQSCELECRRKTLACCEPALSCTARYCHQMKLRYSCPVLHLPINCLATKLRPTYWTSESVLVLVYKIILRNWPWGI